MNKCIRGNNGIGYVSRTMSANLRKVSQGGKWGIYNDTSNTMCIPMEYDCIWATNFPNLWIVLKNGCRGIYNSDTSNIMLSIKFLNIFWPGDFRSTRNKKSHIFEVMFFGGGACFGFDVKKCMWVYPPGVIKYCRENQKDMLPWAYLYSGKPEMSLRYIKAS